jgi:hypothetical protein
MFLLEYISSPKMRQEITALGSMPIRHETQALIANFDVATGEIIHANCGDSRTDELESGVSWEQVKQAYKKLALVWHPDSKICLM